MAEKLRNCPFCGSSSVDPEGWCGPICDDCGASAGESNKSPQENIAAWNTRAVDPLLKRAAYALQIAGHHSPYKLYDNVLAELEAALKKGGQ
jgi:hypothetical protein